MNIDILILYVDFVLHVGRDDRQKGPEAAIACHQYTICKHFEGT
jgi:hypothetical protein